MRIKYSKEEIDKKGWTGWIYPNMRIYRLGCCDCGLIHDLKFKVEGNRVKFKAKVNLISTNNRRRRKQWCTHQ